MNTLKILNRDTGGWLELVNYLLIPALSVLNGGTTVFYIIYLFWWHELLNHIAGGIFNGIIRRKKGEKSKGAVAQFFGGLFQMGIYVVFIVVFFAVIANWESSDITITNLTILMFKNIFFNINLFFIAVEVIWEHLRRTEPAPPPGIFSANMIVLHISIIVGGLIMFFIVRRNPDYFTPDNLWGSVLIIAPFLLLRFWSQRWGRRSGGNVS